ncbi:MAG TPA: fibronectin type III domain-containing protein [Trebonia sp.]|nr:fibronectin type III domain-containing protein [Trebonia sp.]
MRIWRIPRSARYGSATLALVLVAAVLGLSGHGLPAIGLELRSGQAWLTNAANHSLSFIDGFSGEVVSQVGVPGGGSDAGRVINTPEGAAVIGSDGKLITIGDDDFTVTASGQSLGSPNAIELVSGGALAANGGDSTLYAVNVKTGLVQQLDPSSPQLSPVGVPVAIGEPVASAVVAPDGSLYLAIPATGAIGHIVSSTLALIKGVGRPGDRLSVVLAGTSPVAADLTSRVLRPLGPSAPNGAPVVLPAGLGLVQQVTGSDSANGLVGLVGPHAVGSVNVLTGTVTTATALPSQFTPTTAVMQGQNVVLIGQPQQSVLVVNTAKRTVHTVAMPGRYPADQVSVQDGLVFVNASQGPDALVINGDGQPQPVTKYTSPPPAPHKPPQIPAPTPTQTQVPVPAQPGPKHQGRPARPGPPGSPSAAAGNASATVSWGAAAPNGSPVSSYQLRWTGSDGSSGSSTVSGATLGKVVTGLANGVAYTFTINAVNGVGAGPSVTAGAVTPDSNIPASPAGVTATANRPASGATAPSVTVSWTAPDNGYHITSYTVSATSSGVPPVTVTGTSATISAGLVAGTAVAFTVRALGTSSATASAPSAPSAPVTPYLAPSTPAVTAVEGSADGTSLALEVTCDLACQQGSPAQSYAVTLSGGGTGTAAATAGGAGTTAVTVSGLQPNTNYTAQVTVTDLAGVTGPAYQYPSQLTTNGPPVVSAVAVSGNGQAVNVSPTVNPGGEQSSCQETVSVSGAGSQTATCGATVTIATPMYNTTYTASVTATNSAGSGSGSGSGNSGDKALTANAQPAFGTCPNGHTYCGGNSNMQSGPSFTNPNSTLINQGDTEMADCWTTGGNVTGYFAPYNVATNQWVHIASGPSGSGYMNIYWFSDPPAATAGLPSC